jgi:hypothetical protein
LGSTLWVQGPVFFSVLVYHEKIKLTNAKKIKILAMHLAPKTWHWFIVKMALSQHEWYLVAEVNGMLAVVPNPTRDIVITDNLLVHFASGVSPCIKFAH